MTYTHVGSAYGREIFAPATPGAGGSEAPQGYSIAAVVLKNGWKSDELGWLLNELFGGLQDWTEFDASAGARSFVFYGERAEEASSLCDTFAYAWTKGAEAQYNDVVASANDSGDVEAFVEAMLSGEIAIGDSYADTLRNTIFAVLAGDPADDTDAALVERVYTAVKAAVEQHHFD